MRYARALSEILMVTGLSSANLMGAVQVLPSPQYLEQDKEGIRISRGRPVRLVIGPSRAGTAKIELAANYLRKHLEDRGVSQTVKSADSVAQEPEGVHIYLWDYSTDRHPDISVNLLDQEVLSGDSYQGQGYIIRTMLPESIWVVGGTAQGTLYGAMTLLQLVETIEQGIRIPGIYIRDYPDFPFRAASDWLLRIELSHMTYDRGQGLEAFIRLCERRLDRALRFKINMVLMDGFGWDIGKHFSGYGDAMLRLNRYARARGIRLIFGGYGAGYDMPEAEYKGRVFENREWYPDGPRYQCLGGPYRGRGGCRGNEALNELKAEEFRKFVAAVEPGALYIHHEDCCAFNEFSRAWAERCDRCRKRWPSGDFRAPTGGAGALATGYSALIKAVNNVKKPDGSYDASRDLEILLVSPIYAPNSSSSEDWSNVLELWHNIVNLLPPAANVQVATRETFPQEGGGGNWVRLFDSALYTPTKFGLILFFAGGADNFFSDYPLTGTPALNAMFRGARTIYNATGDFYQEPMELINAEYSWNARPVWPYRESMPSSEVLALRHRYIYEPNQPPEIFGQNGLFTRVCEILYGVKAAPWMASYYRESAWLPESPAPDEPPNQLRRQITYLPGVWDRAYAIPAHWLHLRVDSALWGREIQSGRVKKQMETWKIDRAEVHRRQARRWHIVSQLTRRGTEWISRALSADPLPESRADLEFLHRSLETYQPLLKSLVEFHQALSIRFSKEAPGTTWKSGMDSALALARQAREAAARAFPAPVDPKWSEVGVLRSSIDELIVSIGNFRKEIHE